MKVLVPKMYYSDIYQIDYELLKERKVKVLLFDMDNTCLAYKSDTYSLELGELFERLKKMGFVVCLFSNSIKASKVRRIARELEIDYNYFSRKPLGWGYKKMFRKYGVEAKEVVMVGDQLFTDILGGNRVGAVTVLVEPIDKKELSWTKGLRRVEKRVFEKMKEKGLFDKGKIDEEM